MKYFKTNEPLKPENEKWNVQQAIFFSSTVLTTIGKNDIRKIYIYIHHTHRGKSIPKQPISHSHVATARKIKGGREH